MKVAVIGGGISGLSIAHMLGDRAEVVIFESADRPGGLIKCDIVKGNLFHRTGGHVFNTKRQDVLDWFWSRFNKDTEFTKATRNASVVMPEGKMVPYPIENHVYCLNEPIQRAFIEDLVQIAKVRQSEPTNFEEFLIHRFGQTLYELYFKPYNYKVWRRDLKQVSLSWLKGKLPMPTLQEMIYNNMNRLEEQSFVHSSFFYAKQGGSQFLANRLAKGLNIRYNSLIQSMKRKDSEWIIEGETFDKIVFCGNIRQLPFLLKNQVDINAFTGEIAALESHGTTAVFCEIDQNPYSWVYMPSKEHESHRIICTGNFAASNNVDGKLTGTIEFTDEISKEEIVDNLSRIPFTPKYLTHHYEKYTYPIQNASTRAMISELKTVLETNGMYLLGRFAEWEYYNMDVAIGAALDLNKKLPF
ncbi:MAG TPA: UDP-galactopyranose mutase [Chryseobacterium sp.]|nr:UDP-galactopyranose mutase [Chryseobacterium sp.]